MPAGEHHDHSESRPVRPRRARPRRRHPIDITTTGRKTGQPHRIEIVFHNIGGRLYISGMPGFKRSYIANLAADPHFTFHLKGAVQADLAATARIITDEAERREVLPQSRATGSATTSTSWSNRARCSR